MEHHHQQHAVRIAGLGECDAFGAIHRPVEVLTMRRCLILVLACTVAAAAQQVGENVSQKRPSDYTFSSAAQLVVETVAVNDKTGKPVSGLTAKDFQITEDGVPQAIRVFEYQDLPATPLPPANVPAKNIHIYDKLGRTQIASAISSSTIRVSK